MSNKQTTVAPAEQASKQVPTIDTPEFRKLMRKAWARSSWSATRLSEEEKALIAHIDAKLAGQPAAPVAATEQATDELSDEEQAALDRLDKPEWRASSNLKLRAILAVEVANCIRMGAKIENLQDELRATEGYRRGYADGAADAAGIADVQNDWRGIWDEAPVQGEGVVATDGATVIAARWFATGWAKHDHFSEEVEYLPEGWVTHWKPMPAAGSTAPLATPADAGAANEQAIYQIRFEQSWAWLDADESTYNTFDPKRRRIVYATPADAGAELTDEQITEVVRRSVAAGEIIWAGFKKDSEGRYTIPDLSPMEFGLARLIEREVLARLSTSAAPVTAALTHVDTELATDVNAELLKRLEWAVRFIETYAHKAAMPATPEVNKCRAAIAKAKGGAA